MMSEVNVEEANGREEGEDTLITPEDKSYGAVNPNPQNETQQKTSIISKIRQLRAHNSHIGVVQAFVSYVFGSSNAKVDHIFHNY